MISIICCTIRQQFLENVFENYERQDWNKKELILILNRDDMDQSKWYKRAKRSKRVTIYQVSEKLTLGECLNFGVKQSKYDIIAKFDDDDYYSPDYLAQQMNALINMNADVVCKRTVFMYFEKRKNLAIHLPARRQNKFISTANHIKGATLVFHKKIMEKVPFPELNSNEDYQFVRKCIKSSYKVYITDKYYYACLRRTEAGHHTWTINNDELLKASSFVCETDDYKPLIE